MQKCIDKLAAIIIQDQKLLVARSKGKSLFYIPGGKREPGESDESAVIRECQEELSIHFNADSLQYYGTFTAEADDKPEGVSVCIACYTGEFEGELAANAEIAELRWIDYSERRSCSSVTQLILDHLFEQRMIQGKLIDKYDWVLFDADKTLFSFDQYQGLKALFADFGMDFDKKTYQHYADNNLRLWQQYQAGEISAHDIKTQRFSVFGDALGLDSNQINTRFLNKMLDVSNPLPGAMQLVSSLHENGLGITIITNGMTDLQQRRLQKTGFKPFIHSLIVSEEVGAAKPAAKIFEAALADIAIHSSKAIDKKRILMVGDNVESDIRGGHHFGIDTCWINWFNHALPKDLTPTMMVKSTEELMGLFFGDSGRTA